MFTQPSETTCLIKNLECHKYHQIESEFNNFTNLVKSNSIDINSINIEQLSNFSIFTKELPKTLDKKLSELIVKILAENTSIDSDLENKLLKINNLIQPNITTEEPLLAYAGKLITKSISIDSNLSNKLKLIRKLVGYSDFFDVVIYRYIANSIPSRISEIDFFEKAKYLKLKEFVLDDNSKKLFDENLHNKASWIIKESMRLYYTITDQVFDILKYLQTLSFKPTFINDLVSRNLVSKNKDEYLKNLDNFKRIKDLMENPILFDKIVMDSSNQKQTKS
jgi:hypothetical protein